MCMCQISRVYVSDLSCVCVRSLVCMYVRSLLCIYQIFLVYMSDLSFVYVRSLLCICQISRVYMSDLCVFTADKQKKQHDHARTGSAQGTHTNPSTTDDFAHTYTYDVFACMHYMQQMLCATKLPA